MASSCKYCLGSSWPQLLCAEPREKLKWFHLSDAGLMLITVNFSAPGKKNQLFQQSKSFTSVVRIFWLFITEGNKELSLYSRWKSVGRKTQKYELLWRNATYWLPLDSSFSLFSYTTHLKINPIFCPFRSYQMKLSSKEFSVTFYTHLGIFRVHSFSLWKISFENLETSCSSPYWIYFLHSVHINCSFMSPFLVEFLSYTSNMF